MLEMGKVYEGKVKGITNYGAFVEVPQEGEAPITGMVHISEVANVFVNNIRDFLTEGQDVKVVVLQVNEQGKIAMSIRKAMPREDRRPQKNYPSRQKRERPAVWEGAKSQKQDTEMTFEDMINRFKQNSEERISDIKRNTDRKNRSRRRAK